MLRDSATRRIDEFARSRLLSLEGSHLGSHLERELFYLKREGASGNFLGCSLTAGG